MAQQAAWLVLGFFVLLVGPGQAAAQTTLPDTVTVDYTHVDKIGGDSTAISAEVLIFTDQGLFA